MSKIKCLLVNVSGKITLLEVERDNLFEELYKVMKCDCIERISIDKNFNMLVDEEVCYKSNKIINPIASGMCGYDIMNDVVLIGDKGCEFDSLSDEDISHVMGVLGCNNFEHNKTYTMNDGTKYYVKQIFCHTITNEMYVCVRVTYPSGGVVNEVYPYGYFYTLLVKNNLLGKYLTLPIE